ncbi:MAG TPA: DUF1997 domain-containing protein [Nostocaceae cyanobacterium]|nr:DUF1997 domain-containing protein [Nostocaceae cyanobacterium]
MVSKDCENQSVEIQESVLMEDEISIEEADIGATKFFGRYQDCMEMYAPVEKVVEYFNTHSLWFARCAEPMKVQPLGENGYALVIGRFGAFGYEVEPKVGLELLSLTDSKYHIRTIPVPGYEYPGYDVDYKAWLQFVESPLENESTYLGAVTRVEWELDLTVKLHFPKFIQRLPQSIIQSTGDRLLNQVVRQVSRRLTHKVQEHFHQSLGVPFPIKGKKR